MACLAERYEQGSVILEMNVGSYRLAEAQKAINLSRAQSRQVSLVT
jgi:hypothetical protein